MEKGTSTYICTGCGIGESIDTDALCNVAKSEFNVSICRQHNFLCSKEGVELINKDISENELNAVIIGACSPRVHCATFSFEQALIVERVNLREQLAWCLEPKDEDTQMAAEDYLRMAITKSRAITNPEPYIEEDLSSDILVIGGGITGITAAIEGARAGYKILLVEKEDQAGGWANKLHMQLPQSLPYDKLEEPTILHRIAELKQLSNISLLTSATIEDISGQPGNFNVHVSNNGESKKYKVASIVMATGWKPFDVSGIGLYKHKEYADVITSIEMEEMVKSGKILRPSDKKKAKSVLFIQCAGSRDQEHLPYCSSYCCSTSLKQAKYVRDQNRDSQVYIVYKDMRTPGFLENFYKEVQADSNVFFTKGEVKNITEEGESLNIQIGETLVGEEIQLQVDLIVLATGMTPANSDELMLNYRLGKGLPELKYEFSDSHFICFPYETRRTGIYAAGALRAPMDMTACKEDAAGAMLKAIQCLESVKRGEAVHPRSGDTSYPKLYLDRCTDCKRCTEECPFGTYDENEKGTPIVNPNRCRRCGICLGACPERIIDFDDFSINSISSVIKSINVPDEFDEKPRVLVFLCENDAYPAFDMAGVKNLRYSPYVRIIPVRCIGSINKVWISDALAQGFDGILQIGCKPGDDYQCHYIHGSELTETRSENIQETLDKMMLESERIKTEFIEINDYDKVPGIIDDYVELIEEIGPNPFKEM